MAVGGPTSLTVNWSAPSNSPPAGTALFDTYQFYGACGGANPGVDVLSLQADPTGFGTTTDPNKNGSNLYINDPRVGGRSNGPTVVNSTGTTGGSIDVLGNTGFAVLYDEYNNPVTSQSDAIRSLGTGVPCCFLVRAYYYDPTGQSSNTLASQSTQSVQCNTPIGVAPTFGGITSTSTPISANGFTGVTVNWTPVVDNTTQESLFSYYEVGAFTNQTATNFAALPGVERLPGRRNQLQQFYDFRFEPGSNLLLPSDSGE